MKIEKNYSLKKINTFHIDVKAELFCELHSREDYLHILNDHALTGLPKMILGGGSNILFTSDYKGIVLKNNIKGKEVISENDEEIILSFGSGENWDEAVEYCVNKGYGGIENLSLIPGSVGAAPIQNIGAYGVELKDIFHSLKGIFLDSGKEQTFDKESCKFGYRDSVFKNELKGKFLITNVRLKLSKNPIVTLSYTALKNHIEKKGITDPSVKDIRENVIEIRKNKLPDPDITGNAGSFFKNPVINQETLDAILAAYPDLNFFPLDDGFKISAGWLVEKCGLKGNRIGNTGTYEKQALVIINYNEATGKEILDFSKYIQSEVMNKFNILLTPEVNII